jgi:hypothetical protein
MPNGNSHYAKNINFGKAMNENINVVSDPQNPLTSCLFPSADNHFLHGSTTSRYTPHCRECENYMADRCAGVYKDSETWDDKCMLYMNVNQDTVWPNQAAINSTASTVSVSRNPRTVGEHLLRNSLERRYLVYPKNVMRLMQFDPNSPNSPFYRDPCGSSTMPQIKHIDSLIDNDPLMNTAIENYTACADVLAILWSAWKSNKLNISGTKLEKHLMSNTSFYSDLFNRIKTSEQHISSISCNKSNPHIGSESAGYCGK